MKQTRRDFLKKNLAAGAGLMLASMLPGSALFGMNGKSSKTPAILGGSKACITEWPKWPLWDPKTDEEPLLKVMRSGVWSRNKVVDEFERTWAQTVGAKRCLSVVNGTNALIASIHQLGIGPGDEVIVPPYTFIASVQAILMNGAMPVFVDIDPKSFHLDPAKIEAKITPRTKAIMPVHIMGLPADIVTIMAIAKKHNLLVVEDACQAWLTSINDKKVGTFGDAGCFSFQNSKNITMGEGGAIVSDNEDFIDSCFSYHNLGFPAKSAPGVVAGSSTIVGTKIRLTEFQAAIGLAQLKRFNEQSSRRWTNASHLRKQMDGIEGLIPCHLYEGTTQAAYHLFPFRYDKDKFKGMSRELFLKSLRAEGVNCSAGYTPLHTQPFIKAAFESKVYQRGYDSSDLNYAKFISDNQCPVSDKLCNEEAIWIPQNVLLAERSDMNDIASALEKISTNADQIIQKFK